MKTTKQLFSMGVILFLLQWTMMTSQVIADEEEFIDEEEETLWEEAGEFIGKELKKYCVKLDCKGDYGFNLINGDCALEVKKCKKPVKRNQ